jgi:hypothetical protein
VKDVTDSVNLKEIQTNLECIKSTIVSDDLNKSMVQVIDKVDTLLDCKHQAATSLLDKSDAGEETSEVKEELLQAIN